MRKMEKIIVDGTEIFYRGTGSSSLDQDTMLGLGIWFSDNRLLADTYAADGYIVTTQLQARRPAYLSAHKDGYNSVSILKAETNPPKAKTVLLRYLRDLKAKGYMDRDVTTLSTDEIWAALRDKGYDAVIISDVFEGQEPRVKIPAVTVVAVLCAENILEVSRERRE